MLVLAFMAGRFMQPVQKFVPRQNSNLTSNLSADVAWADFLKAQNQALDIIRSQEPFHTDPQSRAEGYQSLLYNMIKAIEVSGLGSPDVPHFTRIADFTAKSGMDNPDNEYRMARINGEKIYRITGQVHSDRIMYIQSERLVTNSAGEFEVILTAQEPEQAQNWLRLEAGVETVLIRYTDKAWGQTHPQDWVLIEQICEACPFVKTELTEADIVTALNRAARSLHDRTASWTAISNRIWQFIGRNEMGGIRETPSGLKGQYSAFGTFELEPDEALILTIADNDADYQGVQLASRWFVSLDYRTHISSLNGTQAKSDHDKTVRYVISMQDPGVWNWLDPVGHKQGLIMVRWQGVSSKPAQQPELQLVKLEDLKVHLPEETVFVTAPQRKAQIARRLKSVDLRFQ